MCSPGSGEEEEGEEGEEEDVSLRQQDRTLEGSQVETKEPTDSREPTTIPTIEIISPDTSLNPGEVPSSPDHSSEPTGNTRVDTPPTPQASGGEGKWKSPVCIQLRTWMYIMVVGGVPFLIGEAGLNSVVQQQNGDSDDSAGKEVEEKAREEEKEAVVDEEEVEEEEEVMEEGEGESGDAAISISPAILASVNRHLWLNCCQSLVHNNNNLP